MILVKAEEAIMFFQYKNLASLYLMSTQDGTHEL